MYAGAPYAGAPYGGTATALREVRDFLQSEPESVEVVIEKLEEKAADAPVLHALAAWTRAHRNDLLMAVIAALLQAVVQLLILQLQDPGMISDEQLERILEENRRLILEQVVEPGQRPNEPGTGDSRTDGSESSGRGGVGPNQQGDACDDESQPPAHEKDGRAARA